MQLNLAFLNPPEAPSGSALMSPPAAAWEQWLAYALPCRRFACTFTNTGTRLGADVDRYSFIVSDLHRLFLAGLPAHTQ